jgi:hypothetical protein
LWQVASLDGVAIGEIHAYFFPCFSHCRRTIIGIFGIAATSWQRYM